jgi:hypothetical protein
MFLDMKTVPLKTIIGEMNAFLAGRPNCFVSLLSSATTEEINHFNRHLQEVVANAHASMETLGTDKTDILDCDPNPPASADGDGVQSAEEYCGNSRFSSFPEDESGNGPPPSLPLEGEWSALSSSDLKAMKTQIDQQLSTVRTELQAFFGLFTDDMVSEAVAKLNDLSVLELIEGAKNKTSSLMELLSAQQSVESSLVDDVLCSMNHVMDAESLVTADDPLEGLMEALQLDAIQRNGNLPDLLGQTATGAAKRAASPKPFGAGPQSYQEAQSLSHSAMEPCASDNLAPVLLNQVQSMAPVIDIDHAGRFSLLPAPATLAASPDKAFSMLLSVPTQADNNIPKPGDKGKKSV